MPLPPLPPLPPRPQGLPTWPRPVIEAYHILRETYEKISAIVDQEDIDPLRAHHHIRTIAEESIPLLQAIEDEVGEQFPVEWYERTARLFAELLLRMVSEAENATGREDSTVRYPNPVTTIHASGRGRPRKVIDPEYLREAMRPSRNISLTQLARALKMNRETLRREMKRHGIARPFSNVSDLELDDLIRARKVVRPNAGFRYIMAHLRSQGLRVQQKCVLHSLRRVDRLARRLRQRVTLKRRQYFVKRPHALWHLDGHHKLILWGFVIHGIIDGYSRAVTALRASTNNRASTVLMVFLEAVEKHLTLPSRVRGDRGGENTLVSTYMIMCRGRNRGSFLWGTSTRNTRIERLWREVGAQFGRAWAAFFTRLEREHLLNRADPHHLWLLHVLFLDDMNSDCQSFVEEWNNHPISGTATGNKSPNDLLFLGRLGHGEYVNDLHNHIHPEILHGLNAGADGRVDIAELAKIADEIAASQRSNIRHPPIKVPRHSPPFDNTIFQHSFVPTLEQLSEMSWLPPNMGITPDEWGETGYPDYELIELGRRRKGRQRVELPDEIWRPRAELWCRAVSVMTTIKERLQNAAS